MSMPPESKRRRTAKAENNNMDKSGHEALFLKARKEIIKNLKHPSRDADEIDLSLNKIRAIITTNDEIWNRCKHAKTESFTFRSCSFRQVHISKKAFKEEYTFETVPDDLREKSFGQPPSLPQKLKDVLSFEDSPVAYATFPTLCCESYLQKCLVLHPEIVPYALVWLQDYLESIQVFCGEIESWLLLESTTGREFLNQTFEGAPLVIPKCSEYKSCGGPTKCWLIHPNDARCCGCGQLYSSHMGKNKHQCSQWGMMQANGLNHGRFRCHLYPTQVLKTCKMIRGEFAYTFQIDKESEREGLKAFLNFASVYNNEE